MSVHQTDLHLGAGVYSSDGKHVGSVERVLISDEGMGLRHIVVKESAIASGHHWYQGANMLIHDVMVPAAAIANATKERVNLNITLSQVRHLPPYLSYQYVGVSPKQLAESLVGGSPSWTYSESAAKPKGEMEVSKGENVMFKESVEILGHVHDLVYDGGELVGIVVRPDILLTHDVLIQTRFIDRGDDLALFAHITEDDVKHLQQFVPDP